MEGEQFVLGSTISLILTPEKQREKESVCVWGGDSIAVQRTHKPDQRNPPPPY